MKKYLTIFSIAFLIIFLRFSEINSTSKSYESDILIKGISLKISLIQTAYEIYNVNVNNPSYFNEDLYKNTSKDAYKHYKWIKKTYSNMDDTYKDKLNIIFSKNDDWDYINAVINLDDDASLIDIIRELQDDEYLNLNKDLKKDVEDFFTYFYDYSFYSYFTKNKYKYDKKATELNNKLHRNNVDIANFVQTISGINLNQKYKSILYYNFNFIESRSFEYENILVSTISPDITTFDILSIPFYKYSRFLFNNFANSQEFKSVCEELKKDKKLVDMYDDFSSSSYSFEDWCIENLISGFSKYLDYKYYGSAYEYTSYVYDLYFYNYLKNEGFNPNKISLKDFSINFYKAILNN